MRNVMTLPIYFYSTLKYIYSRQKRENLLLLSPAGCASHFLAGLF